MNINGSYSTSSTGATGGTGPTGATGDVGQLDGMTLTQGATAPKKSFKAQVKECFREIGQFFKSLTQRKAAVGEPKPAETGSKGDGGSLPGDGLKETDLR